MTMIITLTERAKSECLSWDDVLWYGEYTVIEEFDTFEEACRKFDFEQYDPELYEIVSVSGDKSKRR